MDISSQFREAEARGGWRGVVAGVRCGVRSALPTQALSAPPLIAVFVAAQPISLTPTSFDPFPPLSVFAPLRIRMFMRLGHQQIFLRFLDHCFPYAPLLAPPFNHAFFPLARMPTIAANNLFKALPLFSPSRMESLIAFISIGPAIFNIIFSSPLYSINFDQTVDKFFPQPP